MGSLGAWGNSIGWGGSQGTVVLGGDNPTWVDVAAIGSSLTNSILNYSLGSKQIAAGQQLTTSATGAVNSAVSSIGSILPYLIIGLVIWLVVKAVA